MLHARPVEGRFRSLRWKTTALLVTILFAIPWLHVAGEPLILLDIPARRFHVFGQVFFPQELYFLWGVLALLAVSLFFFTALAGRLWCGWACPQTIFTDLFAAIARRIQGWSGYARPRRAAAWRVAATHGVWITLCALLAFHLVGYFVSPYAMLERWRAGSFGGTAAAFLLVLSGLAYFDLAVVRQTFCKYLCPYARFQGVLFDRDTLVVSYSAERGEPRGKTAGGDAHGDCVDCGLCVQVCPTQIDIRNGLQLECIACTQCIDACDGVMQRLGRAPNLIGYRALAAETTAWSAKLLRPRVASYGALLLVLVLAMAGLLERRPTLDLEILRNRSSLYTTTADGRLGNAFTLHVHNRSRNERAVQLALGPQQDFDLLTGMNPLQVGGSGSIETRVFVVAKHSADVDLRGREIEFVLTPVDEPAERIARKSHFLAAARSAPAATEGADE